MMSAETESDHRAPVVQRNLLAEVWMSTDMFFSSRLTWLLVAGPIAVFGDSTGWLPEAARFSCAGIALIPCAERLSFVTEQVAEHTNGTIGALLNATFGNAPELLLSVFALRAGFYRMVQLAMLGSMLCNLLLVFGISCLIGGLRWQVQKLRIVSGNVNVGMLLLGTAGSLLPAALFMSGQLPSETSTAPDRDVPSAGELLMCRLNAAVMFFMYILFLLFQMGTHIDEFEDGDNPRGHHNAQRNLFCMKYLHRGDSEAVGETESRSLLEPSKRNSDIELTPISGSNGSVHSDDSGHREARRRKRAEENGVLTFENGDTGDESINSGSVGGSVPQGNQKVMPFWIGIVWLFIITLCISSMSDILVHTIEGFAQQAKMSEVFTSLVILPYFSNVAEQASAVIFAYRNEMDLCVGVTVGSAVQIALFVLPGSVLISWIMDRSMTLFFHGYETICLLLGVLVVAAILQGGTTNWLVGCCLIGIYVMMAAGFWVHETEELQIDAESTIRNITTL